MTRPRGRRLRARKLLTGETVPETWDVRDVNLRTRAPGKWLLADLETGTVYRADAAGAWLDYGRVVPPRVGFPYLLIRKREE